jgi:putative component of membrane protein insertase Oxa1/YidC/SpoIIIJ protein YidD
MQQMPTDWEQEVAEIYVNERKLLRPKTSIRTAIIFALSFLLATSVLTWLTHNVLTTVGIFAFLPSRVQDFYYTHPFFAIVILCAIVVAVELFFCLKHAVILAIKLYQHYAPDEIRRRCLFMPTCSEYAIMAVRKYGTIIGLCKSYYRLVYRCQGNIYTIDYPWERVRKL